MSKQEPVRRKTSAFTRRLFMRTSAAAGSGVLLARASRAAVAVPRLEGYASATSVAPGGTLDFFFRDPAVSASGKANPYTIYFVRTGASEATDIGMANIPVNIGYQSVPADASTNGCGWSSTVRYLIPNNWPSGLYFAYVGDSSTNACTVPFVVRPASPTPGVKALLMIQTSTIQAYNPYGGKSLYDYNSTGLVHATQVSFDRPSANAFNYFDIYGQTLVRWLAKNKLAVDFCTDIDIVANPSILDPYQLFIDVGHDEYWTLGRRNTMDAFVARGGNCAYFGANTSWFQCRLEPNASGTANRTVVCYKNETGRVQDPNPNPALKTINYVFLTPPNPENKTTGLGYLHGCSWASATLPRPVANSVVARNEHWAFAGTGLARDTGFGGQYIGYECDSATFTLGTDKRPYPDGVDGSPSTLRILSVADGTNWNTLSLNAGGTGEQSGYSMISVFSRGGTAGTVFNAGTVEWSYGLTPELNGGTPTPISRITLNVINKLSAPWTETADVRQFSKAGSGALRNCYLTTDTSAPAGSGMVLDGLVFSAFPAPVSGSVPVYRYHSTTAGSTGTRYRLSTSKALDPAGAAWVLESATAFNAYSAPRSDANAVYEHSIRNGLELSLLYSTSATPPTGWIAGPAVFYVPNDGVSIAPGAGTGPVTTPSFTLKAPATPTLLVRGQTVVSDTVQVIGSNGFVQSVNFAVSGLPTGVTAVLQPASSTGGTKLGLTAASTAPAGTFTITVIGNSLASGSVPALSAMTTMVITLAPVTSPQDFTLTGPLIKIMPVLRGLSVTTTMINVAGVGGFSETVNFTLAGLPNGVTATPQPASSKAGTKIALTIGSRTVPGSYRVTVQGQSAVTATVPARSATTEFTLVVL